MWKLICTSVLGKKKTNPRTETLLSSVLVLLNMRNPVTIELCSPAASDLVAVVTISVTIAVSLEAHSACLFHSTKNVGKLILCLLMDLTTPWEKSSFYSVSLTVCCSHWFLYSLYFCIFFSFSIMNQSQSNFLELSCWLYSPFCRIHLSYTREKPCFTV